MNSPKERKQYMYCYWSNHRKVSSDFGYSPLFSLATLRSHTDDPIWIIDYSDASWEHYPRLLDLRVIKTKPILNPDVFNSLSKFQVNAISRIFDIVHWSYESSLDQVVAVDSDIFWIDSVGDDLDPALCNYRMGNNGCFSYRKKSPSSMEFLDRVKHTCLTACQDASKKQEVASVCGYFNDEAVFSFVRSQFPHLCSDKPFPYNGPILDLMRERSIGDHKNVHLIRGYLPLSKGSRSLFPLMVEEMMRSLEQTVPGDKMLRFWNPVRRPLQEILQRGMNQLDEELSGWVQGRML